jgi:hypothetical protein
MQRAMELFAQARVEFGRAIEEGLILGNDNHVGDIGEYWARRHFEQKGVFGEYHSHKNGPYDMKLTDGRLVSVKTVTAWSKHGKGTQVKPLCGTRWNVLTAVKLGLDLQPDRIAVVPVAELLRRGPFPDNEQRRTTRNTRTYPVFAWWEWLEDFVEYRRPA